MSTLPFSKPRRQFLHVLGVGTPAALVLRTLVAATNEKKTIRIVQFDAAGVRTGVVEMEKVEKPLSEWKKQLTPEQFQIARQAGTEYPGTGKYANNGDCTGGIDDRVKSRSTAGNAALRRK